MKTLTLPKCPIPCVTLHLDGIDRRRRRTNIIRYADITWRPGRSQPLSIILQAKTWRDGKEADTRFKKPESSAVWIGTDPAFLVDAVRVLAAGRAHLPRLSTVISLDYGADDP
jgi:hypothetical protein